MRTFNVGSLDDFLYEGENIFNENAFYVSNSLFHSSISDNMTIDDILTPAEKQFVVKYALENIKTLADERHMPGYNAMSLYHGQSVIYAALSEELIVNMFSLHNKDFMKQLGTEWWNLKKMFKPQPIEKIRNYFGDAVGIYFMFVGEMWNLSVTNAIF